MPAAPQREPVVTPAPQPKPLVLPEGTELTLVLENALSSTASRPGDDVTARVERAEGPDGAVVLPGGASVEGTVTEARPSGKVKGRARLALRFDRIIVRGRAHPLTGVGLAVEADPQHKRDAAVIGGSAVLGGIIGAATGAKGGFGKGVLIGGAAGTGAVLLTKGKEVEFPAGFRFAVQLSEELAL
jgi:hypothetical protein